MGSATRRAPQPPEVQLAALRQKYDALSSEHRALVRQISGKVVERPGALALASFALRSSENALAIVDRGHILFWNGRWRVLERVRTRWRATAREPIAPAAAPTLVHLAAAAAQALLARRAPPVALARYERPEHGDAFDVRFERLEGGTTIGIAIRDATRLAAAERELAAAHRALEAARAAARGIAVPPARPRALRPRSG